MTYYRLRQEYGGLKGDQVKRLEELEQENLRLRKSPVVPVKGESHHSKWPAGDELDSFSIARDRPREIRLMAGGLHHFRRLVCRWATAGMCSDGAKSKL